MKSSAVPITSINPRFHAQITALLHGKKPSADPVAEVQALNANPFAKPMLRQSAKGPNKTEVAFGLYLAASFPGAKVTQQDVTLRLANGVRYTPDFFCFDLGRSGPAAWETKGFMRDDASVKIKVAAHHYPEISFFLVTKRTKKQGVGWQINRVLP